MKRRVRKKGKIVSKLKTKSDDHKRSRRTFTKSLAAMAATPLVSRAATTSGGDPAALDSAPLQRQATQKYPPTIEALGEAVRYRYGKYLDEDQLDQVKQRLERNLQFADRMKQVELKNGDEPAFIFSADLPSSK